MGQYESSELIRLYYTCNKCGTDDQPRKTYWIIAEHIEEKFKPHCLHCRSSDVTKFKRKQLTYGMKGGHKPDSVVDLLLTSE